MKRNLKPFLYSGLGIILLIVVFCFKSFTSEIEITNGVDLLTPLVSKDSLHNKNTVVVKINKDLIVYVDDIQRDVIDIENILLKKASNDSLTIVLKAEKSVPVEHIVKVMDIANRNKFKVIFALKPDN
ncbi:biopolymer transporter ExbD [Psychroserpens sp. AS72]|uniref:ExbD/TolR family protein n=1 Tax=Psychroserpens sp. AS72 TaxID=3135775 RepID=UPI00316ECE40